jgi:hypothetical protein
MGSVTINSKTLSFSWQRSTKKRLADSLLLLIVFSICFLTNFSQSILLYFSDYANHLELRF